MELDLVTVVLLLAGVLLASALISLAASRIRLPYTVVLVLFGFFLRLAFLEWEGFAFLDTEIPTEVVFFIFLPTLLFESSFNLDSKILFRNIVPVLTLAIPAFLMSTAIVGYLGAWALGLPLATALLFGALISATDPVAVVALFKELGAPKRLMVLVEGESLFNDATAIVLFNVLLGIAAGTATASVGGAISSFLVVFSGGIVVGGVLAFGFAFVLGSVRDNELVEITLTTIVAYMSFIIAEHYLHVSGVMATATAGIILGGWGRTKISPSVSHFMHSFWEYLAFVANSLIFVLVGLALSTDLIFQFLVAMLLAIPIVYFARAVGIALMVPIVNWTRTIEPIDRRYQLVMFWGGLRGALALALALSLPHDFANRELILVASMGVVMATLLVNALTIGPLLKLLGFDRLSPAELFARFESLTLLKREIRERIPDFATERAIAPAIVEKVSARYRAEEGRIEEEREHAFSAGMEFAEKDRLQVLANQALRTEKRHYWEEFSNGHLTEQAYKQLINDVDYQSDHVKAYGSLPDTFREAGTKESALDHLLYRLGMFKGYAQERRVRHIADRFEQNLAKSAAAAKVTALLDRIQMDRVVNEDTTSAVGDYYRHRSDKARRELAAMATDYPEYVERTQEFLLTRSCLTLEQSTLGMLRALGLMPDNAYAQQQEEIRDEFERLRARPVEALRLDPESLLAQIQLFGLCSPDSIQRIAAMMEPESFAEGDDVVRQGESGDSMYVIARGTVEVLRESDGERHMMALLCAGGFFGEIALLADTTRTATVRAAAPCTVLRLRRENLEKLMDMSPDIHDAVHKAYKERLAATRSFGSEEGEAPAGAVSPA